ncbi:ribonuclease H-like domain-containing protein, partial [Tanacetum coccineum]
MSNLKFAETHNLVAFLEKPEESDGFEGIIDFLNASSIRYALTVNPTIYTSCIKQFWATAKAKTVNEEVQIQALVDGKKVIITEMSVRRALQLKDAEGTECLPNATIFAELERMGYENLTQKLTFYKAFFSPQWKFLIHTILQCLSSKTTAWNEFSSTMASAIICLATNQKFNFSKYIFDNMVKNLEGGVKFLMYPRFVQVFPDKQVEGMTKHKEIYITHSHTKKVFANMKIEGKGFSRRVTPLFEIMMPQKKQPRRKQRKDTEVPQPSGSTEPITDEAANEEHVPVHSNDLLLSGEDRLKLNELMELCTNLSQRVLDLENTKTSQAVEITKLKERVKKLERRNKSRTPGLKRLRKVGRTARIESSEDEGLGAQEDASKQGRKIADLDADAEVTLVDEAQERNDDNLMFDTGVFDEEEVEVEKVYLYLFVPTGRYVVPTGRVIATVSIKVPTGSSNAKFPYLKKDEYETWAMKMEYWIMNSDHNLWNIVLHGNSRKWTGRDPRGNIMILPPSLPEDHMADFHHLDDAKDIWLAVKARFGGNEESKKMRKSMLKQEFADFKISESEGLHKGYDRFQKVLSQLNQMQARPDNEDYNMKFLRALPPSWSQVAITLKTKGGLDFLSFDDLYNKLRTLEIDVKGGSSYDSRVPAAPTHSAFISAASTNSKWSTADSKCQPSSVSYTTTSSSADTSGNVLENVLHSFVAESDPQQQITYKDFDQIGKLDLEELDIKWQMAMLSVRINRFEKKAGRKFKFNNKDAAMFDKKKVRCYQCSELGHFARECTGKKVDSKTRYSQFKIKELDKSEEPKALVSVDSMLNWSDHESEDMEKSTSEVYRMIAGYRDDAIIPAVDGVSTDGIFADGVFVATGNGADGVSVTSSDATNAETQFALMGLSPQ